MSKQHLQKLELTWIGKGNEPKLEPRILIEDPEKSFWYNKEKGAAPPWDSLKTGENKQSDKISGSDFSNMLIHGDNLLALKALEQQFAGKIKSIYIDPPYNTGSAFEHYDDGIEHSQWLNLMKPRLDILKNLLSNDGSIWISIDDNECHYLKVLCDEIFGRANFVANVIWQKRTSPDNRLRLGPAHDHILVYGKMPLSHKLFNQLEISLARKKDFKNPDNDPRGLWASTDCTAQAGHATVNQFYTLITPSGRVIKLPDNLCWRFTRERMEEEIKAGRIWFGKDGLGVPRKKTYLSEIEGQNSWTWWTNSEVGHNQEAKKEINSLFGDKNTFDTPKPERLIKRILELSSNENDLILDSFLGSGTTAAVAHKMKRRWIGIELGEHAVTHCIPRLQQVVSGKDQGGISKAVDWKGGGGFKFYTLAPSLIQKDKYGNDIINPQYNANMLAAAMAKQEGFRYHPDENNYWKQGMSHEKDFIFTTTQFVTVAILDKLAEELQPGESLLVCCKSFAKGCANRHTNITIKKIPQMLLGRCEFGKDDYSFNIVNLPAMSESQIEADYTDDTDNAPQTGNISKHQKTTVKNPNTNDNHQTTLF